MTGYVGDITVNTTWVDGDTIDGVVNIKSGVTVTIAATAGTTHIYWNEATFGKNPSGASAFRVNVESGATLLAADNTEFETNGASPNDDDVAYGIDFKPGSFGTFNGNLTIRNADHALTDPSLPDVTFADNLTFIACNIGIHFSAADTSVQGDMFGFVSGPGPGSTSISFFGVSRPLIAEKGFRIRRFFIATFPANFSSPIGFGMRAGTSDLAAFDPTFGIEIEDSAWSGMNAFIGMEQDVILRNCLISPSVELPLARVPGEDDGTLHVNFAGGTGKFHYINENISDAVKCRITGNRADIATGLPDNPSWDEFGSVAIKVSGWSDNDPDIDINFLGHSGSTTVAQTGATVQANHEAIRIDLEKRVGGIPTKGGVLRIDGVHIQSMGLSGTGSPIDPHNSHVSAYGLNWTYRGIIAHNLLDVQIGHRGQANTVIFGDTVQPAQTTPGNPLGSLRRYIEITPRKDASDDFFDEIEVRNLFMNCPMNDPSNIGVEIVPDDYGSIGDPALGDFGYVRMTFRSCRWWCRVEPTYSVTHGPGTPTFSEQPKMVEVATMNPAFSSKTELLEFIGCAVFLENDDPGMVGPLKPIGIQARTWSGEVPDTGTYDGTVEWRTGATVAANGDGIAFYRSSLKFDSFVFEGVGTESIAHFEPVRLESAFSRYLNLRRGIEFASGAFPFQPSDGVLSCNHFVECDVAIRNPSQRQWLDFGSNNYQGSLTFAVEQVSGPFVLVAEDQFWGAGDGPSGAGPGGGDPVSTFVDFTPFLLIQCGSSIFRIGSIDIYDCLIWPLSQIQTPNSFVRMNIKLFDPEGAFSFADFKGQEIEAQISGLHLIRGFADIVKKEPLPEGGANWRITGLDYFGRARQLVVPDLAVYDYASTPKTIDAVFSDMVSVIETAFGLGLTTNSTVNPVSAVSFTLDVRRFPLMKVLRELVNASKDEGRAWWLDQSTLECYFRAPVATAKVLTADTIDDANRTVDIEDAFNRVIFVYTGGEVVVNDVPSQTAIGIREFVKQDLRFSLLASATAQAEALLESLQQREVVETTGPLDLFTYILRDTVAITIPELELSAGDLVLEQIEHEFRIVTFDGVAVNALIGDTFFRFGSIPPQIRRLILGDDE